MAFSSSSPSRRHTPDRDTTTDTATDAGGDSDADSDSDAAADDTVPRWLAPDAKPATVAVLAVLEPDRSLTAADVVDATGFTRRSVERILDELAAAGTVRKIVHGRRPATYRQPRR